MARRPLDAQGRAEKNSWTLSNAPADTQAAQIVAMACARYFIELGFQDAKSSLGLADYQTRGWLAWYHHMALVMLAMQFQLRERMLHAQDHPLLSTADIVELLRHQLPAAVVTPEDVMAQLRHRHRKRKNSIDSACRIQRPPESFYGPSSSCLPPFLANLAAYLAAYLAALQVSLDLPDCLLVFPRGQSSETRVSNHPQP